VSLPLRRRLFVNIYRSPNLPRRDAPEGVFRPGSPYCTRCANLSKRKFGFWCSYYRMVLRDTEIRSRALTPLRPSMCIDNLPKVESKRRKPSVTCRKTLGYCKYMEHIGNRKGPIKCGWFGDELKRNEKHDALRCPECLQEGRPADG
jgi:hypothetical protein